MNYHQLVPEPGFVDLPAAVSTAYQDLVLDELFIARMEGNEGIFSRVMTDTEFRSVVHQHLARQLFDRIREMQDARTAN